MSEETNVAESVVGDAPINESQDSFGDLQDRMQGDDDDSPWKSSSDGHIYIGDKILHDDDGNPITDLESAKAFLEQKQQPDTAKPKTQAQQAPAQNGKPMSQPFQQYAGELTPDRVKQLASAGVDYVYADDLVPGLDPTAAQVQADQDIDPIAQVQANRATWEDVAINPIQELRDLLISNGINQQALDQLMQPIIQKQRGLVDNQYNAAFQKALEEKLSGPTNKTLNELKQKELTANSIANIDQLARKYYPEGGKEAFFALINGHQDETGKFVRGPAANVVDLLVSVATEGKKFANEAERTKAFGDTFKNITADPQKAKAMVDIAHYYWLGKQMNALKQMAFEHGKQAAQKGTQRVAKTIKTPPSSYSQATKDDDEDMPRILKNIGL